MIKYRMKKKVIKERVFEEFLCDRCGKNVTDDMELQETYSINFMGGYSSVFGDMNEVSCDLCQHCLKKLIGDFCIINGGNDV